MRVREDDFYTMGNIDTIDIIPSIRTMGDGRWRGGEKGEGRVEGEGREERKVVEGAYKIAKHPLMHHTSYDYLG